MNRQTLKKIEDLKPVTPQGKRMKRAALNYLAKIRTKEDAFEALKSIGIYNEDGSPNPYFHPETNASGEKTS